MGEPSNQGACEMKLFPSPRAQVQRAKPVRLSATFSSTHEKDSGWWRGMNRCELVMRPKRLESVSQKNSKALVRVMEDHLYIAAQIRCAGTSTLLRPGATYLQKEHRCRCMPDSTSSQGAG
jgi:hypothetical protein